MFAVLYRFDVKEGRHEAFIEAWAQVTEGLKEAAGTLGSCLHRNEDGSYIAYARWPSREAWEGEYTLSPSATDARQRMRENCASIKTLHALEVVADLLVTRGSPPAGDL